MLDFLRPNWQSGVTETLAFRTEIVLSENGKEERIARRAIPRRTLSFRSTLRNAEAWKTINALRSSFGDAVTIGDYGNPLGMVAYHVPAGSTIIPIRYYAEPADDLVIVDRNGAYPFTTSAGPGIGSFSSGFSTGFEVVGTIASAVTSSPIPMPIEAGAMVYEQIVGYPRDTLDFSYHTSDLTDLALAIESFDYDPDYSVSLKTVPTGERVLHEQPNWAGGIDFSHVTAFDLVDYGDTIFKRYRKHTMERHFRSYNFTTQRKSTTRIIKLFRESRGMQGEFYMPSWTADLVALSGVSMSTNTIVVNDHIESLLTEWPQLGLTFVLADGSVFTRKIIGVAPYVQGDHAFDSGFDEGFASGIYGGNNLTVTLDSNLGKWVPRRDIMMTCFTPLCRFASDNLTVNWITHDMANVKVNVQSVDAT